MSKLPGDSKIKDCTARMTTTGMVMMRILARTLVIFRRYGQFGAGRELRANAGTDSIQVSRR